MLFTHMLVKNEINLHVWATGLVLVYGTAAITAHVGLGPGGEYLALAAAVVDVVIGIVAGTKEKRRNAQLVNNANIRSAQELEDLDKRLKAENLAIRNADMRDYEYWFQDVIKEYGLKKQVASDRNVPVELCGVPVLTKHAGILIFVEEDRVILLDPENTGSSAAIKSAYSTQDTIIDARMLLPLLGRPKFRYIHDKVAEYGARVMSGNDEEKNEIWVFNVKDITSENLDYLANIETRTEYFNESETPSPGRITNAREAMSAGNIEKIYDYFPAVLLYIERQPDGDCEIFSIDYCGNEVLKNIASLHAGEDYA
ncbi:hypothetical protein [Marinobacter subterrani]|uniref:Uncharacterized protein n=1 Tax=Marinobacter subterrani TaxID=1658765 RepID=A0A0J7J8T5_9GAMM|nr:hypothetical protein [Marinobacter subterrani]KMQ74404.1 hypothetical protein Msub_10587 [Marinobacter subterrani]